jgi:hypothetical protein
LPALGALSKCSATTITATIQPATEKTPLRAFGRGAVSRLTCQSSMSEVMIHHSSPFSIPHAKRDDKSGTQKPRKSIICDGDFVIDLKARGYFPPTMKRVAHVVVPINHPPISLPCTHPESYKPKPKPWRDTGEAVKGLFFHEALSGQPSVKGFTLMLSRPVERRAQAMGTHCLAWLHRRVVRQLRPLGGRFASGAVPFWLAIEESGKGRLHIHGEISIGHIYGEKRTIRALRRVFAPIRKALKAAGGKWDWERDGDGTQLRFARGTPDCRWAGYCLKRVHKAGPERRRYMRQFGLPRQWVAGFEGKAVTASVDVGRVAASLHANAITEAIHARRSAFPSDAVAH